LYARKAAEGASAVILDPPYLRLRQRRQLYRYTQFALGQLAHLVGRLPYAIRQNEISKFELGREVPTEDELEALSRVLHYSPPSALLQPLSVPDPEPGDDPESTDDPTPEGAK
jgi:transcriptional regulator with XRE-family HTH domain